MSTRSITSRNLSPAEFVRVARPHVDWLAGLSGAPSGMTTAFLAVEALAVEYTPEQQVSLIFKVVEAGKGSVRPFLDHLHALEDLLGGGGPVPPQDPKVVDLGARRAAKIAQGETKRGATRA